VSERAELELEGASLDPGESVRLRCPFCRAKEKSLSLTSTDDGALLFHCYRAGCGASGVLGGGPRLVRTRVERRSRAKPDITGRLVALSDLGDQWGMTPGILRTLGVKWDPETGRIALPAYGPTGLVRGYVLRAVDGRTPKVLSWPMTDEPLLSWNRWYGYPSSTGRDDRVVAVEDIPSALRLERVGVRAVALQGTHLTDDAAAELIKEATDLVIALDADATTKALSTARKLRLHFRTCTVLALEKDIKDQTAEELEQCLSGISWRRSSNRAQPTTASPD